MLRKICPICDHPMKYNHYCSFCNQWVSKPNMVNATYYLNESHPAKEQNCEYHSSVVQREAATRKSPARPQSAGVGAAGNRNTVAGNQTMGNRMTGNRQSVMENQKSGLGGQMMTGRSGEPKPAGNKSQKGKPSAGNAVMVIFVIVIVWILLTGFLPFFLLLF